jgi:hypothetical protein
MNRLIASPRIFVKEAKPFRAFLQLQLHLSTLDLSSNLLKCVLGPSTLTQLDLEALGDKEKTEHIALDRVRRHLILRLRRLTFCRSNAVFEQKRFSVVVKSIRRILRSPSIQRQAIRIQVAARCSNNRSNPQVSIAIVQIQQPRRFRSMKSGRRCLQRFDNEHEIGLQIAMLGSCYLGVIQQRTQLWKVAALSEWSPKSKKQNYAIACSKVLLFRTEVRNSREKRQLRSQLQVQS